VQRAVNPNHSILLISIFLLIIISCSGQKEQPPAPESKEHGVVSEAFEDYCTDCHQGSRALGVAKNVDEWKAVTRKMSQFRESRTGEGIPQDAQDEIIDYLMKGSR
jgi:hypothetical protein